MHKNESSYMYMKAPLLLLSSTIAITGLIIFIIVIVSPKNVGRNIQPISESRTTSEISYHNILNNHSISPILISYSYYLPDRSDYLGKQCESNILYFLSEGLPRILPYNEVDVVFSIVSLESIRLKAIDDLSRHPNIKIIRKKKKVPYEVVHAEIMKKYIDKKSYYILLDCSARGPYHYGDAITGHLWVDRFISHLENKTSAVAATASCEISPHIQTYAMGLDNNAAKLLSSIWWTSHPAQNESFSGQKSFSASASYLAILGSQMLLKHGYEIGSLHDQYTTINHENYHFICNPSQLSQLTQPAFIATRGNICRRSNYHFGPTICRNIGDDGCCGVNPCESIFVFYGGEAYRDAVIPAPTIIRMKQLERHPSRETCARISSAKRPFYSVLVSYVFYVQMAHTRLDEQCKSNMMSFLATGLLDEPGIEFVFTGIQNNSHSEQASHISQSRSRHQSELLRQLSAITKKFRNVRVVWTTSRSNEFVTHKHSLKRYLDVKSHFILLNCAARGPYFYDHARTGALWVDKFLARLDNSTRIIGSTISCEVSPHVQTYAMAFDKEAASAFVRKQGVRLIKKDGSGRQRASAKEIEVSKSVIARGYNIGSLHSRYHHRDFRQRGQRCEKDFFSTFRRIGTSYLDPTVCRRAGDLGCLGVDPCEVMFVKIGGDVMLSGAVPARTVQHLRRIEMNMNASSFGTRGCSYIPQTVPTWDLPGLWKQVLQFEGNFRNFVVDKISEMALIIRTHSKYNYNLLTILGYLQNISNMKFLVIIVVTDESDYTETQQMLQKHQILTPESESKSSQQSALLGNQPLKVLLLQIPPAVYSAHLAYFSSLCTPSSKDYYYLMGYSEFEIRRFCEVDSPTHYLLTDIALYYVKEYCTNCLQLLVTNADNSYSPNFFLKAYHHAREFDVVMTYMITHGRKVAVHPERGFVDLGAFATSVPFLRKTGISFLSSVPQRPFAHDFHDLDGIFVETLRYYHARIKVLPEYLFTHN